MGFRDQVAIYAYLVILLTFNGAVGFKISVKKHFGNSHASHHDCGAEIINGIISNVNGYPSGSNDKLTAISFPYPSGLLITEQYDKRFCLLQHNVVKLRPHCKRVLVHDNLLPKETCDFIIREAEVRATARGGWTADRHTAYPTTDLPLEAIFGKFSSIHGLVNGNILPLMASYFDLNEDYLSIGELFVAKYEFGANKQAGLGAHVDGTPWSFVLALNDPLTDFTGGGTRFVEEDVTYRPSAAGAAVIFSGKNKHEGVSIASGIRYILTGFCNYVDPNIGRETFMTNYDPNYDGNAATGREIQYSKESKVINEENQSGEMINERGNNDHGVRVGDVLKGMWVYGNSGDSSVPQTVQQVDGKLSGTPPQGEYVLFDGMCTDTVKNIIASTRENSMTRDCIVLVERDSGVEEDNSFNEEQRNIPRIASRLLSTGNYWSLDEIISGEDL